MHTHAHTPHSDLGFPVWRGASVRHVTATLCAGVTRGSPFAGRQRVVRRGCRDGAHRQRGADPRCAGRAPLGWRAPPRTAPRHPPPRPQAPRAPTRRGPSLPIPARASVCLSVFLTCCKASPPAPPPSSVEAGGPLARRPPSRIACSLVFINPLSLWAFERGGNLGQGSSQAGRPGEEHAPSPTAPAPGLVQDRGASTWRRGRAMGSWAPSAQSHQPRHRGRAIRGLCRSRALLGKDRLSPVPLAQVGPGGGRRGSGAGCAADTACKRALCTGAR